jgi:hypothetical protein
MNGASDERPATSLMAAAGELVPFTARFRSTSAVIFSPVITSTLFLLLFILLLLVSFRVLVARHSGEHRWASEYDRHFD